MHALLWHRFTFECRVESETVPEVRWFKDNLPLNSPDYETHYDRGLATLTIEETFSEDTARYTCRFTSQSGMAESSAYLTVRGKWKWQDFLYGDFFFILKRAFILRKKNEMRECPLYACVCMCLL